MLLLNIADIHFQHPKCNTNMDPDRPYRTVLIQDVRSMVSKLGAIDAIIVGGDIAYAGLKEEYDAAYEWLKELALESNCKLERVFVVPGNHDVNRETIKNTPSVRNAHKAIRSAEWHGRENELFQQFQNAETGRALLLPLREYNNFAARFGCQLFSPEQLFWMQSLQLDEEIKLHLFGLTSTILSGTNGDDKRQDLYLSPLQTVLDPLEGVVNAVLSHHPPDWFMDFDDIEDALCGRASLQFFGHKHRQRVHRDYSFIRFSAGAVNPDRREGAWEPGYNIVKIEVVKDKGSRFLNVEGHVRVWQTNPDMFRYRKHSPQEDIFKHQIPIRQSDQYPIRVHPTAQTEKQNKDKSGKFVAVEELMSEPDTRNLVLRFWELVSSERMEIVLSLNLITEEEKSLPEAERYGRALRRAGEKGLLVKLAEEVSKRED